MAYKQITDKEEKQIIAYYLNDHTMEQCNNKFGRSKSTVKRIIDKAKNNGNFSNKVEQIKNRNTRQILDVLNNDKRIIKTIDNILDVFQDKNNVKKEFDRKGFQGLNAVMGTIMDKALKYQQMQLELKGGADKDLMVDDGFDEAYKKSMAKMNVKDMIEPDSMDEDV